ncbi:MAG: DUF6318 family protein, partial [Actinomycetota bacterium]
ACAPPAERPAPLPTPTIGSAAPSPSLTPPSPGPLVSEYSPAGATAFVQYYFDVYNYAQLTGNTSQLAALSSAGCKSCQQYLVGIADDWSAGKSVTGGSIVLTNAGTPEFTPGVTEVTSFATYTVSVMEQRDSVGTVVRRSSGGSGRLAATLQRHPNGWQMLEVRLEKR